MKEASYEDSKWKPTSNTAYKGRQRRKGGVVGNIKFGGSTGALDTL